MISSLSPLLLGNYDTAETTLRLYRHDPASDLAAAAPDFGNLLSTTSRADSETTSLQNLFDELNAAANTSPFGTTYGATGTATRYTASTVLIGYG